MPLETPPQAPVQSTALPRGVLFDMDGTLVDTEPFWIAAESRLVAEFGGQWTSEDGLAMVGNPLQVSAGILRERTPVTLGEEEIIERLLGDVAGQLRAHIPWRPGAQEVLTEAVSKGIPTALVTMSYRVLADVFIATLPDGTFDAVVTGDAVTHGKPDPEAYLTAAQQLGLPIRACLALEDSPSGVKAASASGARTVAVPHMVPVPQTPNTVTLDTLADTDLGYLWELFEETSAGGAP